VNQNHKIYLHRLGTPQSQDELIYERPDHKEWYFHPEVTEDGAYLLIAASQGADSKNSFLYQKIGSKEPMQELIAIPENNYAFVGNEGPLFFFFTDLNALRGRVMSCDIQKKVWKEVVGEKEEILVGAQLINNILVLEYLKDAHSVVQLYTTDGRFKKELPLPAIGSFVSFGGKNADREMFYAFTSYTQPTTIYRYDFAKDKIEEIFRPSTPFSCDAYETKQVFYKSRDGTKIPMFLIHKKGLIYDGNNPVYLYGYGGFNNSQTPGFSIGLLPWLEMNGVVAIANIRGGGEYGKAWHEGGRLKNKQNSFDDFIAAAEWLVQEKVTTSSRIGISGGSNGGLLVGACLTQRPDLFGAATPAVGVMDMLRFHKFTVGWGWVYEYGSPDDPEQFSYLLKYSPLHNIHKGTAYPPTLILTADHDDRVFPAHSYKFAAALQAAQASAAPILIRIESMAGHGMGMPTSKRIDELADKFAFLAHHLQGGDVEKGKRKGND
jgi:prolyl oligopeptidase